MKLHMEGWDSVSGSYRVTRSYTPEIGRHNFAWFVEEAEALRCVELYKPLVDAEVATAGKSAGQENA